MTVRVPAKVNVQLSVGPLREDGYHDLVNVFHAVSIFDEVVAKESEGITVQVNGKWSDQVPTDDSNLAIRAARALAKHAGRSYGAELVIHKSIPVAGGMAGGSADAAGALVACNELWGLGLPMDDLMEIAGDLGSDVPFSLIGGTAVGTGRGEQLSELPTGGTFHWVFALANGGSVDGQRVRRVRPAPGGLRRRRAVADAQRLPHGGARHRRRVRARHPSEQRPPARRAQPPPRARPPTLESGRQHGALGAIVSGSGPTCAFLAIDATHARDLAHSLTTTGTAHTAVAAHGPVHGATLI
ncbi:4-(cytidine 5'-diphospho)-2-C-methyl-D-erythritol kinase [Nonomuraea salmonea]